MAPTNARTLSNGSAPVEFMYPPLDELQKAAEKEITLNAFTSVC